MIIKHCKHMAEKFTRCAKVCGLCFTIVLFRCGLAGQANFIEDEPRVPEIGQRLRILSNQSVFLLDPFLFLNQNAQGSTANFPIKEKGKKLII